MYVTPEILAYALPTGSLFQTIKVSGETPVTDGNDIGFSKGFGGGVEDDSPSGLWDEE